MEVVENAASDEMQSSNPSILHIQTWKCQYARVNSGSAAVPGYLNRRYLWPLIESQPQGRNVSLGGTAVLGYD